MQISSPIAIFSSQCSYGESVQSWVAGSEASLYGYTVENLKLHMLLACAQCSLSLQMCTSLTKKNNGAGKFGVCSNLGV